MARPENPEGRQALAYRHRHCQGRDLWTAAPVADRAWLRAPAKGPGCDGRIRSTDCRATCDSVCQGPRENGMDQANWAAE